MKSSHVLLKKVACPSEWDATIITGHWAALGLHIEPNVLAIDSGCVWGRQLTAVRLEDRTVYQVEYADRRD